MHDDDTELSQEERLLLEQYEARRTAQANSERFMEFAGRCSCDYAAFWKPHEGLQLAFGSQSQKGRINNLVYVIEMMPKGKEWHITLIASRDPELPAGEGEVGVVLRYFQSDTPTCPEGYSALQKKLWAQLYKHFWPYKPKRRRT